MLDYLRFYACRVATKETVPGSQAVHIAGCGRSLERISITMCVCHALLYI